MDSEENIKVFLSSYGRDIEDEAMDKVEELRLKYNLSVTKMGTSLLSYLTNNKIYQITEDVLNNLSAELNKKSKIKEEISITTKPIKTILKPFQPDDFMQDYKDENKENVLDVKSLVNIESIIKSDVEVKEVINDSISVRYMYARRQRILSVMQKHTKRVSSRQLELAQKHGSLPSEIASVEDLSPVGWRSHVDVYVYGQISLDHTSQPSRPDQHITATTDSQVHPEEDQRLVKVARKITSSSIALRGFGEENSTPLVQFNIDQLSSYSFFPGQTVLVKGCSGGSETEFLAKEVYPSYIEPALTIDESAAIPLKVMMAAGPFSEDARDVKKVKAQLEKLGRLAVSGGCCALLLFGPFLDCDSVQTDLEPTCLADNMLMELLTVAADICVRSGVHLVVVPAVNDLLEFPVFPQCQFIFDDPNKILRSPLVHLVSNPSQINIGPYRFAVSSLDIMRDLAGNEINKNCTGRINRLCSHLLSEGTLYPLVGVFQPAVHIDWVLWDTHARLDSSPHFLILPSKIVHFKEVVESTVCINPGLANGSYSILDIHGAEYLSSDCQFLKLN